MPFRKTLSNTQSAQPAVARGTTQQTAGWAKYFGPARHGDIPAYDEKDRATWTLPESYTLSNGRNEYLASTFEELSFFAENWYTQICLPIQKTNKTGIQWEKYEFSNALTDIVPEMGVTRLVESSRTEGSASLVRRGLGFRLEHGFMNTELGRQHYRANIAQINRAVQETNNFNVIFQLLGCDDHNAKWERENGYYRGKQVKQVLENDVFLWDILKQTKNGMYILDTWVTGKMERYKGQADMWIVTPEITQYLTQVPKENTDYWIAGAKGPERLRDGVNSFTPFREGQRVYVTRTYDVDKEGPVDPMASPQQIGEAYIAKDMERGSDYKDYRSINRSIQIYDEGNDKFETLDLNFLLENAHRHGKDGKLLNINSSDIKRNPGKFTEEQINADFLHYIDRNNELQTAKYMGQTRINVDDVLDVGRSILNTLPLTTKDGATLHKTFYDGIRAINLIESYSYDEVNVKNFFAKMAASNLKHQSAANVKLQQFHLQQIKPNSYGSLDLPVDAEDYELALPPGYANAAGFRTIAAKYQEGEAAVKKAGFQYRWFKIVSDFMDLINDIVSKLKVYLPNAIVLDRNYASPWWLRPDAVTVFFENVISKHRYPLWLSSADEGAEAAQLDKSFINAGLNETDLTEEQVADLNAISQPFRNALKTLAGKYADGTLVDGIKNLYEGGSGSVTGNAKFNEAVKTIIRVALLSYTLGASVVSKNKDETSVKMNKIYAIIEKYNNNDQITDPEKYAKKIITTVNKNKDLFRAKSINNISQIFNGILEEIEQLKSNSVTDDDQIVLLHRRGDVNNDFVKIPNNVSKYHRSPLTGSPELFYSIISTLDDDPKVLPSSPLTPNRPVNGSEAGNFSALLDPNSGFTDLTKVPAVLQPSSIGDELHDATHIAACVNVNDLKNQRSNIPNSSRIEAIYPNDEDDFYTRSSRRSGILSLNKKKNTYGRRSTIRNDDSSQYKKRVPKISSATVSDRLRAEVDVDEGLFGEVSLHRFQELYSRVHNEADDPLIRVFGLAFLLTPTNLHNYKALVRYNIALPLNFLVFRPHARYIAHTVIKMKAGTQTGATYMGNSHFTLGDDAITQEHVGSYTYYSNCVVYEPKNVFAVRNAYINGYEGGMGVQPYDIENDYNPVRDEYGDGSIFVIAVPRHETNFPNPLSITGEFHYFEHSFDDLRANNRIHYSTAPYYNRLYGWQAMGLNGDLDLPGLIYGNEMSKPNSIVYLGHTRRYSSVDKKFSIIEAGTGHWKAGNTYEGCNLARKGQLTEFDTVRYN